MSKITPDEILEWENLATDFSRYNEDYDKIFLLIQQLRGVEDERDLLLTTLQTFVKVSDADQSKKPLLCAQGQGMDGYTKLALYDSAVEVARVAISKLERE